MSSHSSSNATAATGASSRKRRNQASDSGGGGGRRNHQSAYSRSRSRNRRDNSPPYSSTSSSNTANNHQPHRPSDRSRNRTNTRSRSRERRLVIYRSFYCSPLNLSFKSFLHGPFRHQNYSNKSQRQSPNRHKRFKNESTNPALASCFNWVASDTFCSLGNEPYHDNDYSESKYEQPHDYYHKPVNGSSRHAYEDRYHQQGSSSKNKTASVGSEFSNDYDNVSCRRPRASDLLISKTTQVKVF